MAQIILLPEDHIYQVDGEVVPSVSEIVRFITKEIYNEIPQDILDAAAARGTAVHKATEALDIYKKVECDEITAPYVKAYAKFLKDVDPSYVEIEWSVCHPDKLYCGTIDRVYVKDDVVHILDVKTTSNIDQGHKTIYTAKLSLYAMASKYTDAKLEILQLKKDESYKLIPLEYDEELAKACITLHERLKKKPRKRKEN